MAIILPGRIPTGSTVSETVFTLLLSLVASNLTHIVSYLVMLFLYSLQAPEGQ